MPGFHKKPAENKNIPLQLSKENIDFVNFAIKKIQKGKAEMVSEIEEIESEAHLAFSTDPAQIARNRRALKENREGIESHDKCIEILKKILLAEKITPAEQAHLLLMPQLKNTFIAKDNIVLVTTEDAQVTNEQPAGCCLIL